LISHGTHAVSAEVVAQLYSPHFSSRENVAAERQEIAALFDQYFPDEWFSMPDTGTVAEGNKNVAEGNNAVVETNNTVAEGNNTVAESDKADAASVNSSVEYHDNDQAYDATFDDINLQQEAAAVPQQHYYTQQRQGQPDWGIQDPGWHKPRAPTSHPDAKPLSYHRMQDWNVRVTQFTDTSGYTIENADIIYRLPSAPGNTVRYHPLFVPGTLEHQLHHRPLSER
jgi:hypothetical protein